LSNYLTGDYQLWACTGIICGAQAQKWFALALATNALGSLIVKWNYQFYRTLPDRFFTIYRPDLNPGKNIGKLVVTKFLWNSFPLHPIIENW